MLRALREQEIDCRLVEAVDGKCVVWGGGARPCFYAHLGGVEGWRQLWQSLGADVIEELEECVHSQEVTRASHPAESCHGSCKSWGSGLGQSQQAGVIHRTAEVDQYTAASAEPLTPPLPISFHPLNPLPHAPLPPLHPHLPQISSLFATLPYLCYFSPILLSPLLILLFILSLVPILLSFFPTLVLLFCHHLPPSRTPTEP